MASPSETVRYYVSFLLRMVQREGSLAEARPEEVFARLEEQVLGMLRRREGLTAEQVAYQATHLAEARARLEASPYAADLERLVDALRLYGEDAVLTHLFDEGQDAAPAQAAAEEGADAPAPAAPAAAQASEAQEAGGYTPTPSERRMVYAVLAVALLVAVMAGLVGGLLAPRRGGGDAPFCPSLTCYTSDWIEVPVAGRNLLVAEHKLGGRPSIVQVWMSRTRDPVAATLAIIDPNGNPRAIEADAEKIYIAMPPDGTFTLYDPVRGAADQVSKAYIRIVAMR